MKTLAEFISESIQSPRQTATTTDFIDNEVWVPNDDLSKKDLDDIIKAFYKKYPANSNGCGEIRDAEIKCEIERIKGEECVKFTFYWCDLPHNERIDILNKILDLLADTIYSIKGGRTEIRKFMEVIPFEY